MEHNLVFAGTLKQQYIIPPSGIPSNNIPGGDVFFAAAGARLWVDSVSLLARVGENYPTEWLNDFEFAGFDTSGIKIIPDYIEAKTFEAYDQDLRKTTQKPATTYLKYGQRFPKELLNFHEDQKKRKQQQLKNPDAPRISDIPTDLLDARVLHISGLEIASQSQLISFFKQHSTSIVTVNPLGRYMDQQRIKEIQFLLNGVTIFCPTETQIRKLFLGITMDLWSMAEAVGSFGCDYVIIVRNDLSTYIFESVTKRKWEIPRYPSVIKDPSGAESAFSGGMTAGYYLSLDPVEAALYGNVSSSVCTDGTGAMYCLTALPDLAKTRLKYQRELIKKR